MREGDGAETKVAVGALPRCMRQQRRRTRGETPAQFNSGPAQIAGASLLEQGLEPNHDLLTPKRASHFRRDRAAGQAFDQRLDYLLVEPMRGFPVDELCATAFDRADGR